MLSRVDGEDEIQRVIVEGKSFGRSAPKSVPGKLLPGPRQVVFAAIYAPALTLRRFHDCGQVFTGTAVDL